MAEKTADPSSAEQLQHIIRGIDSLSTLPCVARRFITELIQSRSISSTLVQIIESDPALAAAILSVMKSSRISFAGENPSIRRALTKLPADAIRSALFSTTVLSELDNRFGHDRIVRRRELVRHSMAVACCCEAIAQFVPVPTDHQLAYAAGLLHDLGKLTVDQAMPKSFAYMMERARAGNCSSVVVEQEHLGLDHATLGRRISRRWRLPDEISTAIWLHHSDIDTLSEIMPDTILARIVRLADSIARQHNIGDSGSYGGPNSVEELAKSLQIEPLQLQQIEQEMVAKVEQKAALLGLNMPGAGAAYTDTLRQAAARLDADNCKLSSEKQSFQTASSHLTFLTELLQSLSPAATTTEAAENIAVRWQRFYQTGVVCLYLIGPYRSSKLEAVLVETLGQSRLVYLDAPNHWPPVPAAVADSLDILNEQDDMDWLFDQLDNDFDPTQAKLLPLQADGRTVGAIVFELRYPADTRLFREHFKMAASVAASVLDMICACSESQDFLEKSVRLLTSLKAAPAPEHIRPQATSYVATGLQHELLAGLAELASGAAHELNNPLSVIAGRAQLLADSTEDRQRKRILNQIRENADEIAAILSDLMAYAEPQPPRPQTTNIKGLLDEAVEFARQKADVEHINAQVQVAGEIQNVRVDSAQIVSATANIICNALESYAESAGPVKIKATPDDSGRFVEIQISDLGCGMDAETAQKATLAFFSAKPAGRKRGMGLAHARRLIELNNGSLKIESERGRGTTVTLMLPQD